MDREKILKLKRNINAIDMCLTTGKTFCPLTCEKCAWNIDEISTTALFAEFVNAYVEKVREQTDGAK